MLFSSLIQYLKDEKSFHISLQCSTDLYEIRDVALLDGTQNGYEPEIVYFGYSDVLKLETQPSQCILVENADHFFPYACSDRASIPAQELFAVFNAAKQYIQQQEGVSFYDELLQKASASRKLDEMINYASLKLGNSLIVCDMKFRILSHSVSIPVTDPLWKTNVDRGYCTYDFIKGVMSLEPIQKAASKIDAIEVSCPESDHRKYSSKVFLNGLQVGFVLMIEENTPFTSRHLASMSDLSRSISFVIGRYQPELIHYSGKDQQLLDDLLIGTPAELRSEEISHLHVSDAMYALCIKPENKNMTEGMKKKIRTTLQRIFPEAYMTIHDHKVVLLIPDPSPVVLEDNQKYMLQIMEELKLDVGISLAFSRMDQFFNAYRQACTVLEWNKRIPEEIQNRIQWDRRYPAEHRAHRYSEIQIYEMLKTSPDSANLRSFIHPALARLRQFDAETGNELYHTLDVYLHNFHNNKDTARVLNLHRNSLAYRLEKINEISKADLQDPATELLLRISFKIEEYLEIQKTI